MKWIKLGDSIFDGHACNFIQINVNHNEYFVVAFHKNEYTFTQKFGSYEDAKKYLSAIHSALDMDFI